MFPFFKKAKSAQPAEQGAKDWQQQKNAVAERLLRDFPWLWAIKSHHSDDDAESTKVSQHMGDLKLVLSQPSEKRGLSVWAITSQVCEGFNMRAKCLDREDSRMWCEAAMQQTNYSSHILYLVVLDAPYGEKTFLRRITIFRHPEKKPLNELVAQVCQLHGSDARWLVSSSLD